MSLYHCIYIVLLKDPKLVKVLKDKFNLFKILYLRNRTVSTELLIVLEYPLLL